MRAARQGRALHEAARAHRRGGEADPRHRRARRHLRRLPRGSRLHAEDAEGARRWCSAGSIGDVTWARSRETHPGPAQRVVLGREAGGRRADRRPRLPLHRDRPQLHRQGQPAARGDVLGRHARAPDRGRGQRDRADQVRVGRDRPVRGLVDVPRRDGPARRGRRHRGDDLARTTSCAPASRRSAPARAAGTSPRRRSRRAAGCSPSATRSPSSATSTCSPTCSTRWTRGARRWRRSTTATS